MRFHSSVFVVALCLTLSTASQGPWEAWGPYPGGDHSTTKDNPTKTSTTSSITPHTSCTGSASHSDTSKPSEYHGHHHEVTYSGPDIDGQGQLPASLSSIVFPRARPTHGFPHMGSGRLGQNALPQSRSNGGCPLGTFGAPKCPPYVGSSRPDSDQTGAPWGGRTASGTNPYTSSPNTGVTRTYHFNVARGVLAPDGVQREMILINGQFPGPTIEANWGDSIEVIVTNNIVGPEEGTSFHWHGLLQTETNCEDGVPGITQCPIPPGGTFTYTFKADLYGTSWWHSHFSAQYAGGAFGAMVIYGPKNADHDVDLGPVLLTDYYHDDYYSIVEEVMGTDLKKAAPFSDNNLINGKGNYNCSLLASNATSNVTCTPNAGLAKFQFTSGKTHRLRLINAGAEGIQRFSIDGHSLEVIAYDFVPIRPYTTNTVTLGIGQRADVLVKANGNSSSAYWMRSTISGNCSLSKQPNGLAIIYYQHANTTAEPTTTSWTIDDSKCANDPLSSTMPFFPLTPPKAGATVDVEISFKINSTGHFLWTVDGSSFRTDYNKPILPQVQANNASSNIKSFPTEWNVYNFGANKSFIINVNNNNPVAHPLHIHGHNMFVLAEGTGAWDGHTIQGNPWNPTRRDVQIIRPNGYVTMQVDANNPGIWPFHCHIAWHVSGGLYMNILERPSDIPSISNPTKMSKLCSAWSEWTSRDEPDMIDSGLRRRGDGHHHGPLKRKHDHFGRHRHQHQHVRHTL